MDLFNDSYIQTSERTKKWIKNSWAEPFAQIIFPAINENRFEILYHEDNSRPNTPVNYVLGALIIKEILSLSDEDLKLCPINSWSISKSVQRKSEWTV